jgi:hypothetical protein
VKSKPKAHAPTRCQYSVLRQICNYIPEFLVPRLAGEHGVDTKARSFSPWSHVVSLIHSQLTHSIGLKDVCDSLRLHSGPLSALRGATPPSRNSLSHANRVRDAAMAEALFWEVLNHLQDLHPQFAGSRKGKGLLRRFRRTVHAVDSTTIQLVANCVDWARHRRRKAAAKCHVRLDLQSFLPKVVIVDSAREHDSRRARELCAGLHAGEVVVFDKAYLDFSHLHDLGQREVFWVTRARSDQQCRVIRRTERPPSGHIVADELVELLTPRSRAQHPGRLRRVVANVEIDGHRVEMTFLTNNLEWSAQTIADLYRSRWQVEVFFKQMKQTLQLADFLGQSANAVRWQVWVALLVYVLLRFLACLSQWEHSFTRLWALTRSCLWDRVDLLALLWACGTAGGHFRLLGQPEAAYLPGFG